MRACYLMVILIGAMATATAGELTIGELTIREAVVREGPPSAPALAGYLQITNNGTQRDELTGAASEIAGRVDLHNMTMKDGVMEMSPAGAGFEILPGETLTLESGGKHIMFMMLNARPTAPGDVLVELIFARAGPIAVPFKVVKP